MSRPSRPFVTGGTGFVGRHLLELLGSGTDAPGHGELDLLDAEAVEDAIAAGQPDVVIHLAALASVEDSWANPRAVLLGNLEMTVNLLEAMRRHAPGATLLFASSGEVYGPPVQLPVDESAPLHPANPYAVSKAACDLLAGQYAHSHGMRIVRTRAFNHAGPGQSDSYLVGTLTRQVAQAETEGAREAVVRTGNPDSARDFTDVRDVVRAHVAALEMPAGAYNICSGRAVSVRELIELLRTVARVPVRHEVEDARRRVHDVPTIVGSAERLSSATGWRPTIPLARTVADALEAWRNRLRP